LARILDNGLDVPPILFPYLPVPAEKAAPHPDFKENVSEAPEVPTEAKSERRNKSSGLRDLQN
jgi:hypothetical protein